MSSEIPELKKASEIAAELKGRVERQNTDSDPKSQKEYAFKFRHVTPRGHVYVGEFTNKILTLFEKQQVKVTKARMAGGVPVAALDAVIWDLNERIAHMTFSLIDRPDWAQELTEIYDEDVIYALYEEVASHEARFFGRKPDNRESAGTPS